MSVLEKGCLNVQKQFELESEESLQSFFQYNQNGPCDITTYEKNLVTVLAAPSEMDLNCLIAILFRVRKTISKPFSIA